MPPLGREARHALRRGGGGWFDRVERPRRCDGRGGFERIKLEGDLISATRSKRAKSAALDPLARA